MLTSQKLMIRQSEQRSRALELAGLDGPLTDEQRTELDEIETAAPDLERQLRAALTAEAATGDLSPTEPAESETDREYAEMRAACSVGGFVAAAIGRRQLTGAEAEYAQHHKLDANTIPLDLFEQRSEPEQRTVTGAPSTTGVNLDVLRPAVFAPSILPRLGVEMPRVASGTYATGTITTSTTADAVAKGAASPATAAAFTVTSTTPHRISARLELTAEDIASVGQSNFEGVLRENIALAMSDELDRQGLTGDGTSNDLTGLIARLTNPTNPTSKTDWAGFAGLAADHVDGLWASMESDVSILLGVSSYQLAAKTFREPTEHGDADDTYSDTPGSLSALAYLASRAGNVWTNNRMPAASSSIQTGIAHRRGRMGMRTAVCPVWGEISIDDMYSGSSNAERYFSMHILVGDVILVQPAAYSLFETHIGS